MSTKKPAARILTTPPMERCIGCQPVHWPVPRWSIRDCPGTQPVFGLFPPAACLRTLRQNRVWPAILPLCVGLSNGGILAAQGRVLLSCMVACLFARAVCRPDLLADCLNALGYTTLAGNMEQVAEHIQKTRWRLRLATGFDPRGVKIPKRFTEVTTWKGAMNEKYLKALMREYAKRIMDLARDQAEVRARR